MFQLNKPQETQFQLLSTALHSVYFHLLHKEYKKKADIYIYWVQLTN